MKKTIAILLTVLLLAGLMTGCGAKESGAHRDDYNGYYESSAPGYHPEEAKETAGDYAYPEEEGYYYDEPKSESLGTAEKPVEVDTTAPASDKIIYTANVSMESTEFDSAVQALESMVSELNGYVENSNVSGTTRYNEDGTTKVVNRYAYYTVAIPSSSFTEALNRAGSIGNVVSKSRNAENISSRYSDTEARVESLEVQEERVLAMMKETTDIESLIALEARLSDITYEKESYQRMLKNYDRQVAYSTIDFTIREVEVYTPTVPVTRTFGEKLADAFSDGWTSFTNAVGGFFLWLVEALPHLILWAVIIVGVIHLIKSGKPRRMARRERREEKRAQKAAEINAKKAELAAKRSARKPEKPAEPSAKQD